MFHPNGCTRPPKQCLFKHPNGKLKKDAETSGDGEYNKRDLTPVRQRQTPVDTAKYIYDKGEPVKVDPKAAAARERNKNPRVKARDPESD
jgi:hypothetical protein